MFLPRWASLYSDLAMAPLNRCVLTQSRAPQGYLMLWSHRSPVAALESELCAENSISCFASCRQGAGLVYVPCVHPHPSKYVCLTNKTVQFSYMVLVLQHSGSQQNCFLGSCSWVSTGGEGWQQIHVHFLNCKWQVLPLVFLPANAHASSEGFFCRGRSVAQTNLVYKCLFLFLRLDSWQYCLWGNLGGQRCRRNF